MNPLPVGSLFSKTVPRILIFAFGLIFGVVGWAAEKRPPNILLILADDMSPDDLAGLGNPHTVTPILDALAGRAVTFSEFSVTPLCAPSRATLLTGRNFMRTGVSHVHGGKDHLHRDERTIADALRAGGYATAMWGKWHSGKAEGYRAHERGFDEALSLTPLYQHHNPSAELNGKLVSFKGWADEILVDHAVDFIKRHQGHPWFAYVASMTPHSREDAPEHWVDFYRKKGLTERIAKTYAMVSFLDEQLGRLLAVLKEQGEDKDTIVIFLSDNGPPAFVGEFTDAERTTRNVSGRRGWKADLWQNGVKAPLFVCWPDHFKPASVNVPVDLVDLFPTLLELAGVALPAGHAKLDGRSLVAGLRGGILPVVPIFQYANPGWGTRFIRPDQIGIRDEYGPVPPELRSALHENEQILSVREGRWKLLQNPDNNLGGGERDDLRLVDLDHDPLEKINVAADHPDVVARLQKMQNDWWTDLLAEPHAFEAPVFDFPANAGGTVSVFGRAPLRADKTLLNTTFMLRRWRTAGQWSEYHINVSEAGRYRVTLKWAEGTLPMGGKFQVTVGDRRAEVSVSAETATGKLEFAGGVLELRPGDTSLRFEFKAPSTLPVTNDLGCGLSEIVFVPAQK